MDLTSLGTFVSVVFQIHEEFFNVHENYYSIKTFCAAEAYYIFKYLCLILLRIQNFSLKFSFSQAI